MPFDEWQSFKDVKVERQNSSNIKRRYSVTADILSFRRCPRQYGYNVRKNFVPARPLQEFVGTVVHQVLDRAHNHYSGKIDESLRNTVPSDDEIEKYFMEVEESLKSSGVRAVSGRIRDDYLEIVKRFNRIEGPRLYPRVKDTEHRLEKDEGKYVIHGVVDVLVGEEVGNGNNQVEIWDYKGTKRPENNSSGNKILQDYLFQMQVYMYLYKEKNGSYPSKGVIYFLGELGGQVVPTSRPSNAIFEVDFNPSQLSSAIHQFKLTADEIESSIDAENWKPPSGGSKVASRATCDICDIRWTCREEKGYYKTVPTP
jgi:putative RecB family exonuclease